MGAIGAVFGAIAISFIASLVFMIILAIVAAIGEFFSKKVGDPDYESTEHQAGDSEDKAYYIEILGIDFNYTLTELQMACRREKAKHEKGSAKWKEIDEACRYLKEYLSNS